MKVGSLMIEMAADLARLRADMDSARGTVDGAMRDITRMANNAKRALGTVAAAFAIIGSGGALSRITSQMTDFEARLARVVGGTNAARAAMDRLNAMALRTYSDFGQTAESYLNSEGALRALGATTGQTMNYVEALNNALVVSGAKAERAATVQDALQKAMALGKLSGDQLNTVIANGGRVAELLAAQLGVNVNQLRAVGQQGKITATVIYDSLAGNLQKLRAEADAMPVTIMDAFARIATVAQKMVYDFDTATGASAKVAAALVWVADNMGLIVQWGTPVAAALLAIAAPTLISGLLGVAAALGKAAAGLALIALSNPLATLAVAAVAAVAALVAFRDEIKLGANETATLGDLGVAAFDDLKGGALTLWGVIQSTFSGQRDELGKTTITTKQTAAEQEVAWLGMLRSVLRAFDALGGFLRGFLQGFLDAGDAVAKAFIRTFSSMGGAIRKALTGDFAGALAELKEKAAIDFKQIWLDAVDASFESQQKSGLESRLDQWVANAKTAAAAAAAEAASVGQAASAADGPLKSMAASAKKAKDEFAELMKRLDAEDAGVSPKFAEELATLHKGLEQGRISMDAYIVRVQRLIAEQKFAKDAAAVEAKAFDDLMASQEKSRQTNEAQIRSARQTLENIQFETRLLGMNTRERAVAIAMRDKEREGIVAGTQAYEAYAEQIRKAIYDQDAAQTAIAAQKEVAEAWRQTSEQIGQQFTDALIQGGASVKEALKRMFQNIVLRPIIQPIMTSIGGLIATVMGGGAMAGQGGAGTGLLGSLGMSALGSAGMSAVGGIGAAGGFGGFMGMGSFGAGFGAGVSALVGEAGIAGAFSAGTTAIGAGNLLGGLGTLAGAALPIIGGLALLGNAFGLFAKTVKRGDVLMGTLGQAGGVQSADLMRRDGTLFGGPDWFTDNLRESPMDTAIQAQWSASLDVVKSWTSALSLSTDGIDGFTAVLNAETLGDHGALGIRLDGLSEQEIQGKIFEAIRTGNNDLAQQIIGTWDTTVEAVTERIKTGFGDGMDYETVTRMVERNTYVASEFARDGERAIDTLDRLGGSLIAVNELLGYTGQALYANTLAGGDAASLVIDQFGGREQFNTVASAFVQNFFPAADVRAKIEKQLSDELAKLDLKLPDTTSIAARQQWRDMAAAQDRSTESGRQAWATLLQLSGTFAQLTPAAGSFNEAIASMGQTIKGILDGAMGAEDAGAAAQQAAEQMQAALVDSITGALTTSIGDTFSQQLVAPLMDSLLAGAAASSATLAAGGAAAAGSLAAGGAYAAGANAQGGAAAANAMASGGASAANAMVSGGAATGSMVQAVVEQARAQIAAMGQILADPLVQAGIKDISTAVGSLAGDLYGMRQSFGGGGFSAGGGGGGGGGGANKLANAMDKLGETISQEIKRLRGIITEETPRAQELMLAQFATATAAARAGDKDALSSLTGLSRDIEKITVASAVTNIENIRMRAWLANSLEETMGVLGLQVPAFAVGTNYVPYDTLAMVHAGERIMPAADNAALMAKLSGPRDDGNADVAAELRAVRAVLSEIKSSARSVERNTDGLPRMSEQFDLVTEGGNVMRVREV